MNSSIASSPNVVAVLAAAGIGSRMQTQFPKQYLKIGQYSILEHAAYSLLRHEAISRLIVVIHPHDQHFSQLAIAADQRVNAVYGGVQRADSVLAGLNQIEDTQWVVVHDAARPCLRQTDLERLLQLRSSSEIGGILAAPVRDTIKSGNMTGSQIMYTVPRDNLWHTLTPQLFPAFLLKRCLQQALSEGALITDEASALEYCGYHPEIVAGRIDNIKITYPEDLALAEFYLNRQYCEE